MELLANGCSSVIFNTKPFVAAYYENRVIDLHDNDRTGYRLRDEQLSILI